MKRTLSLLLALALCASLLGGCGGQTATESTAPDRADADIDWQYMSAEDTKAMLDSGEPVLILDSRPDDMYNAGHIPGAYHLPCYPVDTPELEQLLVDAAADLKALDAPIVIVCKTGNKGAKRAISVLIDQGVPAGQLYILEGGGEGWTYEDYLTTENDSPAEPTVLGGESTGGDAAVEPTPYDGDRADAAIEWQYITAEDTKAKLDAGEPLIVLDTRQDDMYSAGHIEGCLHVPCFPVDTLELENVLRDAVPTLQESDDPIAVVCKTGNKGAKRAISVLIDEGVSADRLFILEGGGEGWPYDTVTD